MQLLNMEGKLSLKKIKAELKQLLPKTKIDNKYLEGGIELNFYNAIERAYPKYKELSIKAKRISCLMFFTRYNSTDNRG